MQFGRTLLEPSYLRRPDYETSAETNPVFRFICSCNHSIETAFETFIAEYFGWEERLGKPFASKAKEFYKIGVVGKSPDGGWPSMVIAYCPNCRARYLLYAGVKEVYNSVYKITVQGITELVNS